MAIFKQVESYLEDQWHLKVIGDKIKLTHLYTVKESGWEEYNEEEKKEKEKIKSDEKLRRNLFRARNTIFEYAYCNEWDYFFTGTLDSTKISRDDLTGFEKYFSQMVRDLRKKTGTDIQYLIVPELHSDMQNWHCHGLIKGLSSSCLRSYKDNKYNWIDYEEKFGFNSLEAIRSHEAVSKYLTKYVTKCYYSNRGVSEVGKHLYLVSRGLAKGKTIKKGRIKTDVGFNPTFSNDFCEVFEFGINQLEYLKNLYV